MFRFADGFQLDKRTECSRAGGSDAGEKLRKRLSRKAHTVHDRPGKTLIVRDKTNSKKEAHKRERKREEKVEARVEPVS